MRTVPAKQNDCTTGEEIQAGMQQQNGERLAGRSSRQVFVMPDANHTSPVTSLRRLREVDSRILIPQARIELTVQRPLFSQIKVTYSEGANGFVRIVMPRITANIPTNWAGYLEERGKYSLKASRMHVLLLGNLAIHTPVCTGYKILY